MAPVNAGYSGTPLAKKLGIKDGSRILTMGAPAEYRSWLGSSPEDVAFTSRAGHDIDIAHVFSTKRADLARELKRLRTGLRADAAVWVSWPKKAAKVPTDITEDVIREVALPMGFVDIKVCAVT
jgi:hypothetical protein